MPRVARGYLGTPRALAPSTSASVTSIGITGSPRTKHINQLRCSFAATGRDEIQQAVRAFGAADFLAELDQLVPGGEEGFKRPAVVDLGQLTEQQREVARLAAERGYLDSGGPSAAEVADTLDISKATLSEHLSTVEAKLLTQAFREELS